MADHECLLGGIPVPQLLFERHALRSGHPALIAQCRYVVQQVWLAGQRGDAPMPSHAEQLAAARRDLAHWQALADNPYWIDDAPHFIETAHERVAQLEVNNDQT
jgi:hypothetical protein